MEKTYVPRTGKGQEDTVLLPRWLGRRDKVDLKAAIPVPGGSKRCPPSYQLSLTIASACGEGP